MLIYINYSQSIDLFLKQYIIDNILFLIREAFIMKKETLIIAIFVALIILWAAEILNMKKTSKLLGGIVDIGFSLLR